MATRDTKLQIIIDAQDRAAGTLKSLGSNLDAVSRKTEDLRRGMTAIGAVGAASTVALGLVAKTAIQAGSDFEQTSIAFRTMLGSATEAERTLKELAQFAARTPFELPQLEEASKRFLAYGLTAEDLIPTLRMLGDISAGVGMDKLPQLILAFGQVRAATKLTGMELRQFSETGVPLLGTLAKQLNKTEGEILEMVSAGQISFPMVQQALASLTSEGGKFFNLMENQSSSLGGLWSNLKDQISLLSRSIGTELLPYLKPLVEQFIAAAEAVGAFVKEHPRLSAFLLMAFLGISALMAVMLPLAIVLPGLMIMFGALGTAFAVVTAMSAPLLLAIGAIVAILAVLAANGYLTKEAWQSVWLGMKVIAAEAANAIIGVVEGMVNFLLEGVNRAIRAINSVIRAAQKVPGLSKKLSTIGEVKADFGRFDTSTIAASDLAGRANPVRDTPAIVQMAGNVFLSTDVAEQIGNMILGQLKLSRQL